MVGCCVLQYGVVWYGIRKQMGHQETIVTRLQVMPYVPATMHYTLQIMHSIPTLMHSIPTLTHSIFKRMYSTLKPMHCALKKCTATEH